MESGRSLHNFDRTQQPLIILFLCFAPSHTANAPPWRTRRDLLKVSPSCARRFITSVLASACRGLRDGLGLRKLQFSAFSTSPVSSPPTATFPTIQMSRLKWGAQPGQRCVNSTRSSDRVSQHFTNDSPESLLRSYPPPSKETANTKRGERREVLLEDKRKTTFCSR